MRMDTDAPTTARAYLASVAEDELKQVLRDYGDLKKARALARAIVRQRDQGRMNTTSDLVAAVSEVFDFVSGVPEETRTVFQAIRIAVNEELDSLQEGLNQAIDLLAPEGRIVAISFHSGEDRIVKNTLRAASRKRTELHPDGRIKDTFPPTLKLLTPKPALPSAEEAAENPRARSAKLRAAERVVSEEKT